MLFYIRNLWKHHVIKLILLKISKLSARLTQAIIRDELQRLKQKEHKDCCLKCQPDKSALAKHAWENDHPIKWDDFELLVPVRNYFSRQIGESVEIFKNKTILKEGNPLHGT